jgi:hypothetical protein
LSKGKNPRISPEPEQNSKPKPHPSKSRLNRPSNSTEGRAYRLIHRS